MGIDAAMDIADAVLKIEGDVRQGEEWARAQTRSASCLPLKWCRASTWVSGKGAEI